MIFSVIMGSDDQVYFFCHTSHIFSSTTVCIFNDFFSHYGIRWPTLIFAHTCHTCHTCSPTTIQHGPTYVYIGPRNPLSSYTIVALESIGKECQRSWPLGIHVESWNPCLALESMALDFHRISILLDTGLLHFGLSNLLDFKAAWNDLAVFSASMFVF